MCLSFVLWYPPQNSAPNLSNSPLRFETSWDKDQRLLGWGKRSRAASGWVPSSYSSETGARQVNCLLLEVAVNELSPQLEQGGEHWHCGPWGWGALIQLQSAGVGKVLLGREILLWLSINRSSTLLSHESHLSKNSRIIFGSWLTSKMLLFTLPSLSWSNYHQCQDICKSRLFCAWRVKINTSE